MTTVWLRTHRTPHSIPSRVGAEPRMSSAKPDLLKQRATFDLIELVQLRHDYGLAPDTPDSALDPFTGWCGAPHVLRKTGFVETTGYFRFDRAGPASR